MNPWEQSETELCCQAHEVFRTWAPSSTIVDAIRRSLSTSTHPENLELFRSLPTEWRELTPAQAACTHPCTFLLNDELFALFFPALATACLVPDTGGLFVDSFLGRLLPCPPQGKPTRITLPLHLFDLDQLRWIQAFLEHESLVREPHETSLERRLLKAAAVIKEACDQRVTQDCRCFL